MIHQLRLRLSPQEASSEIYYRDKAAQRLNISTSDINGCIVRRRSVDARKRQIWVDITLDVYVGEGAKEKVEKAVYKNVADAPEVIIVGSGPAGLFAALRCLELGVKPIVLERGNEVSERKKDIAALSTKNEVNEESNYCFGEGGAGTFSDGKLYTRSLKRGNTTQILEALYNHGASYDILVDAHPHIGTDKLPKVIQRIRSTIINHGGEIRFNSKVVGFIKEDEDLQGVTLADGSQRLAPVILATGHSSRDMYKLLHKEGIALEAKSFAVGVRLEHPQRLIDNIQYHSKEGRGKYLPAASYSFVKQVDGRGVYSFCMCPGGIIVPSATADGQVVVNGMSSSQRNSRWANAGIVVEVSPHLEEGQEGNPLAGIEYQENLEQMAYVNGGSSQAAPAQRMIDFAEGRLSFDLPKTSYAPGVVASPMHLWLPEEISKRLQEAFKLFGKVARGFYTNDALVIGVESRTSSPVRILRDSETMQSPNTKNLYPCGEGAGYAGGIVSSAIDGVRCAEAVAKAYGLKVETKKKVIAVTKAVAKKAAPKKSNEEQK